MREEKCNAGALFQYLLHAMVDNEDIPTFDWVITGAEVIQQSLIKVLKL